MTLLDLQTLMTALADPTRLRVLYLLFAHQSDEWDVATIVDVLELPQPTVSRHLARLRDEALVDVAPRGKQRLYRLADHQPRLDRALLAALETFVAATPEVQEDLRRAARILAERATDPTPAPPLLTSLDENATNWLLDEDDDSMGEPTHNDAVFRALAHRGRRALVDAIQRAPGSTLTDVTRLVPGTRQAVRKHVDVLVEAELVHVVDDGRHRRLYYNAVPLQELYDRWTDARSASLARSMLAVKNAVEQRENDDG